MPVRSPQQCLLCIAACPEHEGGAQWLSRPGLLPQGSASAPQCHTPAINQAGIDLQGCFFFAFKTWGIKITGC